MASTSSSVSVGELPSCLGARTLHMLTRTYAQTYIQLVPPVIQKISFGLKHCLGLFCLFFGFLCTPEINYSSRGTPRQASSRNTWSTTSCSAGHIVRVSVVRCYIMDFSPGPDKVQGSQFCRTRAY